MLTKSQIRIAFFILAGTALQLLGIVFYAFVPEFAFWAVFFLIPTGTIIFSIGCMYYARIKGYSMGLFLGIFFSLFGLLIIFILPKKEPLISEEKILQFLPKTRKGKIILIFAALFLLAVLIIFGKQIAGLAEDYAKSIKTVLEFQPGMFNY